MIACASPESSASAGQVMPTLVPSDPQRALSFDAIYRNHVTFVRRVLQRKVPPASVDDAVQDVFVVVHRRLQEFDGRHAVTNWLYEIAWRVAGQYRRGSRRALTLAQAVADAAVVRAGSARGLQEELEQRQLARRMLCTLRGLGPQYARVVLLADLLGCTGLEIAALTDTPAATVYTRLRRAHSVAQQSLASSERLG